MLVTCFSMDRLLVSVTPRFFACKENRISVSPMRMEVGWGFGREVLFETMSRHSVLSSFSLSLFDVIHVFTSEMQSCMPWTEVSIWSGRQESCSWVSYVCDRGYGTRWTSVDQSSSLTQNKLQQITMFKQRTALYKHAGQSGARWDQAFKRWMLQICSSKF